MKLSLTRDTLAYQLGVRPALQFRDLSTVPLKQVINGMNEFMDLDNAYQWVGIDGGAGGKHEAVKGDPHKDAIIFYLLEHTANILRRQYHPLEPLPGAVMALLDTHAEQMAMRGARLFYYLLAITTREARHSSGLDGTSKLTALYGSEAVAFIKKVMSLDENEALKALRDNPPNCTVGQYLGIMTDQFRPEYGTYSHSFGGLPWSNIAKTAWDFTKGEMSLELMMDKAFALEHNTSAIFNKPVLYHHSHGDLKKILDVQRAGQIPQLVYEAKLKSCSDKYVQEIFGLCRAAVAAKGNEDLLGGQVYVDWYKVEEFAADNHKYPQEKKEQAQKTGVPEDSPMKAFVAGFKQGKVMAEKEAEIEALVQIFPKTLGKGDAQFIKKYKRVKA